MLRHDGRKFYAFYSTITNKNTGEPIPIQVKFRQTCRPLDASKCPRIIEVDKKDANLNVKEYTKSNGEEATINELWIGDYEDCGEFVDDSLDDYY